MGLVHRDNPDTRWASSKAIDPVYDAPEQLWDFILAVLERNPPAEVIEILAAGPMEDYLAKLGAQVIEKVEQQAATDPRFRSLLGGVWRNSTAEDVWRRVQACWDRSGWDGNP